MRSLARQWRRPSVDAVDPLGPSYLALLLCGAGNATNLMNDHRVQPSNLVPETAAVRP